MLNVIKWLIILLPLLLGGSSCKGVVTESIISFDDPNNPNTLINIEKNRIKNINIAPKVLAQEEINTFNLDKIQKTILLHRPHVAILSYFFSDSLLYLHFITSKSFSSHQINIYPNITNDIALLNKQISQKKPEQYNEYVKASKRLYDCLISPIAEQSNGYEWLIIPDDFLYSLNFGALAVPPTPTEDQPLTYNWVQLTFLAGEVTISYSPSIITALKLLNESETKNMKYYSQDTLNLKHFFMQNQLLDYKTDETNDVLIAHLTKSTYLEKPIKNVSVLRFELQQPVEVNDFFALYAKCFENNIRSILISNPINNENNFDQLYYDFYCIYLEMRSAPYALRSAQQNRIGHPTFCLPFYWANERVWGL